MSGRVPELKLSAFTGGDPAARQAFGTALFGALRGFGFVVLKDHGVAPELLERAYVQAQSLFALPEPVKRRYVGGMRGYTPFGVEHAKDNPNPDLKEFWQIGREPPEDVALEEPLPANIWPAEAPGFRETFQALFHALDETGRQLLQALAPSLDLPTDWFDDKVRHGAALLRVLHYPPVGAEAPVGSVRSAAHEDINFLTIMVAARGAGLQVLTGEGDWLPVETDPGGLIVNSGDMLARLTNGVIPSTTHRVVNPPDAGGSRYSMPFFLQPTLATSLACLPSCEAAGPPPPITAAEFLAERLREIGLAG